MEKIAFEKSLITIEDFRLRILKALTIFLVIKKKPANTIVCKKYEKNWASQEKAITTSETLMEYTMRSCTTIDFNNYRF